MTIRSLAARFSCQASRWGICLLLAGLCYISLYHARFYREVTTKTVHTRFFPIKESLKLLAIDNASFVADLYWIEALNYIGSNFLKGTGPDYLTTYADIITYLDPHFYGVYDWFGTINTFKPNVNIVRKIAVSNYVLFQGIEDLFGLGREFSKLWFDIGHNLAFELGDTKDATPYLDYASSLDKGRDISNRLVATYYRNQNRADKAIKKMEVTLNDILITRTSRESDTTNEPLNYYLYLLKNFLVRDTRVELLTERLRQEKNEAIREFLKKQLSKLVSQTPPPVADQLMPLQQQHLEDFLKKLDVYRNRYSHVDYDLYTLLFLY